MTTPTNLGSSTPLDANYTDISESTSVSSGTSSSSDSTDTSIFEITSPGESTTSGSSGTSPGTQDKTSTTTQTSHGIYIYIYIFCSKHLSLRIIRWGVVINMVLFFEKGTIFFGRSRLTISFWFSFKQTQHSRWLVEENFELGIFQKALSFRKAT